jgi:hypothetical protein
MLEGRSDAYIPVLAGDMKHPSLDLPAASMPLETCIPALAGDILVAPTLSAFRWLSPFLSLRRSTFAA